MAHPNDSRDVGHSRRRFLRDGTAITAAAASSVVAPRAVHSSETTDASRDLIRIALVGAGGRGGGAANNTLSINDHVKLVSIADTDADKPARLINGIQKKYGEKVAVEEKKIHVGLDAYKRVLDDPDVDLVMFATPPGFRPQHIADAVEAGKHVFAEKPSCVDPAGYRVCLDADKKAREYGTAIVTGTQYRRQTNYMEAIKRIHDGVIGDIISATARYCSNGIWYKAREDGMSDTQYQIYNWMHFVWLSGDQIVEQAVHNIDAINWIMGGPPETCFGSGGRFTRPEGSEMWDSVSVDYLYPGNRMVSFKCRQIPGTKSETGNVIYGSKGIATIHGGNKGATIVDRDGNEVWSMKGDIGAAYEQEHKDLVDSIRAGQPIVELEETANSSLTAVMGRLAAYTGQYVDWEFLTKESKLDLFPKDLDMNASRPESTFAIPGKDKLI